jgi:hypothetical protein
MSSTEVSPKMMKVEKDDDDEEKKTIDNAREFCLPSTRHLFHSIDITNKHLPVFQQTNNQQTNNQQSTSTSTVCFEI